MPTLGILANPVSGRDVRRTLASAPTVSIEAKRNQVRRLALGASSAGVDRFLILAEPFRIASDAFAHIDLSAEVVTVDVGATLTARDTQNAVDEMREMGCDVLAVLGGDGTNRAVAKTWRDAPVVALSVGTNNVFPKAIEPTVAGRAAGLVATGRVSYEDGTRRSKLVHVGIEGEDPDLAVVDAAVLVGDHLGSLAPFAPEQLRSLLLARAEPAAVGMSPIGGLLEPSSESADFGVLVDVVAAAGRGAKTLDVPISPGLVRPVHVARCRRVALGRELDLELRSEDLNEPAILAFDGDRARRLRPGQRVNWRIERDGPRVVDVERTLAAHGEGRRHEPR